MEKLLYLIAGVLTGSIVLVIWFSMMPLGSLKEAALKVIKGELGAEASVWGHSEAAVTAVYFNRMSRQIAAQVSGSRQYQEKYEALAPLWLFGKSGPGQNLPQVKQGWYPTMAVKTGEEKKDLNWLLEEIHGRGGEALSFDKGQVWCLFSRNVEDALEAAVEILAPLKEKPGFMASLAIDYEEIRLGVIGDESRSELAAFGAGGGRVGFLRSCGEKYGSPFLVTEAALRQLPEAEKRFHLRLLGTFWFKASSQAERVYEVLDGAGSFSCQKKLLTRANFEKGRKAFEEGDFSRARTAFVEVLQEDREDRAALHYIRLCEDRQDHAGETPYMEVY